jgi:prophage antirepressor-like protein
MYRRRHVFFYVRLLGSLYVWTKTDLVVSLRQAGSLRPELDDATARDIFWTLTGGDVYRLLVRERGWSSQKYQDWLADTLVHSLLSPGAAIRGRGR